MEDFHKKCQEIAATLNGFVIEKRKDGSLFATLARSDISVSDTQMDNIDPFIRADLARNSALSISWMEAYSKGRPHGFELPLELGTVPVGSARNFRIKEKDGVKILQANIDLSKSHRDLVGRRVTPDAVVMQRFPSLQISIPAIKVRKPLCPTGRSVYFQGANRDDGDE